MPFDGSGNYVPPIADFPAVSGTTITAAHFNNVINDIATALNLCLTRDGQGKPSAAINWNGQNLSGVGALSDVSDTTSGAGSFGTLTVTGASTFAAVNATGTIAVTGTVTATVPINAASGGTGVDAHLAANGTLLIGTGTGFALATLTAGSGITITNGSGSIIVAATGGGGSGTTSFALTVNNSGTGTASPFTFDGSAAKTLSWNSIGAKPITPQIQSIASSATPTPTFSNDLLEITALAANATFGLPTGTAVNGWGIVVRVKDNGTARTLAYNAIYRAVGTTLPTTTVVGKWTYFVMIYNATDTKWDVTSVMQQ